ncbi:MAG TPA: integrase arm-type DNA-binding domain-containing protein, partial [Nitrospirota bacterium]
MPKRIVPLSEQKVKKAKSRQKQVTHFDGGGLFLLVSPSGGKLWRFKYRFGGKEKILAFGKYPEITLADARQKREAARRQIANGIDPGEVRKAQKLAKDSNETNFEVVAREWHEKFSPRLSHRYAETLLVRLEREVFPWIGSRPISTIKAPDVLTVLRRIETRGTLDTAKRIKILCGQVMRYAVATGRADRDPTADLKGALPPARKSHFAAVTDPKEVGALLRVIDGYQGSFVIRAALRLAPLVFVRPGELRHAEWSEVDLEAGIWSIPAEKMKMKQAHLVPLSRQAREILTELKQLTGNGRYLFPSIRSSA